MTIPRTTNNIVDWVRRAATAINTITNGFPYQKLGTAPGSPTAGQSYYDTTTNKVRTYDGTTWQNHW